ncbi:MAG: autotransporter outer membrane beta-barrel domain-containing protein [Cyclobacteriaceae bacterium]
MKYVLLLLCIVALAENAYGQFEKGRILAGGSASFAAQAPADMRSTTFSLMPDGGYFVANRVVIGAGLGFSNFTVKFEDLGGSSLKSVSTSFSIEPFVRYYLEPGVFFAGAFGYGLGKSKNTVGSTTTTSKFDSSQLTLSVGYAYFLNTHVAIEPAIGYRSTNPESGDAYGSMFLNIGLQIYLGGN